MVYLDNAATSFPKPKEVVRAVAGTMEKIGANPGRAGHKLSLAAGRIVEGCREALASYMDVVDSTRIVFCLNCTDALNMAIHGFVRHGDHVISTVLEHNSVLRPLCELARLGVITLTLVTPDDQMQISPMKIEQTITPATRLCVINHVSNVVGAQQNIPEIARVCHVHGIRVLVDAAQSAGAYDIKPNVLGADMVAMPGHKGLYGPHGTGALYMAPNLRLAPMRQGGTGSVSESMFQPEDLPDRFESGTMNLPGLAGLLCGIRYVQANQAEITDRVGRLSGCIYEGLMNIRGINMYSPPGTNVISFNIKNTTSGEMAGKLDGANIAVRGGLHCAPAIHRHLGTLDIGAVRVSPGSFTTESDVSTLLRAVRILAEGRLF